MPAQTRVWKPGRSRSISSHSACSQTAFTPGTRPPTVIRYTTHLTASPVLPFGHHSLSHYLVNGCPDQGTAPARRAREAAARAFGLVTAAASPRPHVEGPGGGRAWHAAGASGAGIAGRRRAAGARPPGRSEEHTSE